jgi:predicted RNA binding protein YcfA (HicA-like mRNA interferase family)
MTARDVESLLQRYGFRALSQKGSHRKWRNDRTGAQVVVPEHRGRNLPLGTLHSILTAADIPPDEWRS